MKAEIEAFKGGQSGFAKHAGIDRSNLNKTLNATHEMSVGTFIRVCAGLGWAEKEEFFAGSESELKSLDRVSMKSFFNLNQFAVFKAVLNFNQ